MKGLRMRRTTQNFSFWTVFALLLVPLANTAVAADDLLFLGDFEHGIMSLTRENAKSPWNASGNATEVVTAPEPVRYGQYAMKSVLERKTSRNSYRTAAVPRIKGGNATIGLDYWYGFSTYFTKEWTPDDIWELVAQWYPTVKGEGGMRHPILAFYVAGDQLQINDNWDVQPGPLPPRKVHAAKAGDCVPLWEGPLDRERWTDWVVHVKWSYNDDGFMQVWRNGQKIIDRTGPNYFNDKKGPYLMLGVYKGWKDREEPKGMVDRRVMYYDEVRIAGPGGSYQAVSPPGTPPAKQ